MDRARLDDRAPGRSRSQLGHTQSDRPADLAGDHLGNQHLGPLTRATELHDVGSIVVGFDDARQRSALAKWRDVPDRLDVFEQPGSLHMHGRRTSDSEAVTGAILTAPVASATYEGALLSHSVPAASVPEGTVMGVDEYAVGNNGDYFAVGRKCRHLRADLAGGSIDADGCLVCPWHEAKYDVSTGQMVRGPQGIFAKIPGLGTVFQALTRVFPLKRGSVVKRGTTLHID